MSQGLTEKAEPPKFFFATVLCIFSAAGGIIFGYDTGTISGYINMSRFIECFGELTDSGYVLSSSRAGLLVSIFSIGACFGGLIGGRIAESWGRRTAILAATGSFALGNLIQICAVSAWYQILVGRIFAGIGVGAYSVVIPMFQSEISPAEVRGVLVTTFQVAITFGILFGNFMCFLMNISLEGTMASFRIPMGIAFIFCLFVVSGMFFSPESPRYLLSKGRYDEATAALCRIYRRPTDDEYVQNDLDEMYQAIEKEREVGTASWIEIFTGKPRLGYRLMIGIALLSFQQLSGPNYFFYYGTNLFKVMGVGNAFATSMVFSGTNFVGTIVSLFLIHMFGRRQGLLTGASVMFIAFIIFSTIGTVSLYPGGDTTLAVNTAVSKAMISVTCLFIFSFAITWGPLPFLVVSEIYPLRMKSKGMSLATAALWFWTFCISFFSPLITAKISFKYGYVFSCCVAVSMVFVFFCVPETKSLTLEQIDELFASDVKAWHTPKALKDPQDLDRSAEDTA